jgi:hypothetical protein
MTEPQIVVQGDELPSAYGAPGAFSRSRFSPITNGYVLPPGEVFAALIYQGDFDSRDPADSQFTQEVELGLPYRFGVAIENELEFFDGDSVNASFSIEGRWALRIGARSLSTRPFLPNTSSAPADSCTRKARKKR